METKKKKFDAVEMSRELREKTSALLNAMTREEQLAYLKDVREKYRAEWNRRQSAAETKP